MRLASRKLVPALALAAVAVAAGCGGTGSETPWPVEPYGLSVGLADDAPPDLVPDGGLAAEPEDADRPDGGEPGADDVPPRRVDAGR